MLEAHVLCNTATRQKKKKKFHNSVPCHHIMVLAREIPAINMALLKNI